MQTKSILNVIILIFFLLPFGEASGGGTVPAQLPPNGQEIIMPTTPLQVADFKVIQKIPAPQAFLQLDPAAATATLLEDFIITYTGDWPAEAITAFNYAASIWSSLIDPAVKITINAHPDSTGCAACAYITLGHDYPGLPQANTWYPRTLINEFSGTDILPVDFDFDIYYYKDYPWYYGTDGNPTAGEIDFVSVILHEIGHGLGFIASYSVVEIHPEIRGRWGTTYNYPINLDSFIVNGAGQSLLNTSLFPNPSYELGVQLLSDNIFFDGPETRTANQNLPAKVDAKVDPHSGGQGKKCDHLEDGLYDGTPNALMTATINYGEVIHNPGPIFLGMLADLGWTLSPNLPVFYPIPSQMMLTSTQRLNAVDLWAYIPAVQLPGTNFTYEITNTPAPEAGVSLHDNRYIDLVPAPNWLGWTEVMIKATNQQGQSTSETFTILVVGKIHSLFLPDVISSPVAR